MADQLKLQAFHPPQQQSLLPQLILQENSWCNVQMSMIATISDSFLVVLQGGHKSSQQRGFFQLGTRSLNSDGFEEDDESKILKKTLFWKIWLALALEKEELLKESQNDDDEMIHIIATTLPQKGNRGKCDSVEQFVFLR